MASDLTKAMGNALCRWIAGEAFLAPPDGAFLAIYVGDPKAAGTDVTSQIRTAGRVELAVTAPAPGVVNTMQIDDDADFGDAANAVNGVSHLAIWSAQSGGYMIAAKAIPGGAINIAAGAGVKYAAGDLSFVLGS